MAKSMTGYGIGESFIYNRKFKIEIKSVNSRHFELNLKMPRSLNQFESKIRENLAKSIFRGKLDVYISFTSFSERDVEILVNENILNAYYHKLAYIKDKFYINEEISLTSLESFEGVFTLENKQNPEDENEFLEGILKSLDIAIDGFNTMRQIEGNKLVEDIQLKSKEILEHIGVIEGLVPLSVQVYERNLREKIQKLLENKNIDEERLLMEVAILSDKTAIDEELVRLKSHIEQMDEILLENAPIGRKMDFLVQEINREINTIGSKANNLDITRRVVELKSILEKIREQVQNIE